MPAQAKKTQQNPILGTTGIQKRAVEAAKDAAAALELAKTAQQLAVGVNLDAQREIDSFLDSRRTLINRICHKYNIEPKDIPALAWAHLRYQQYPELQFSEQGQLVFDVDGNPVAVDPGLLDMNTLIAAGHTIRHLRAWVEERALEETQVRIAQENRIRTQIADLTKELDRLGNPTELERRWTNIRRRLSQESS